MLKEKISLKRLVGLSQEDGEKLLLAAGYIQDNTYCDDEDCIEGQRYHDDTYYSLYDEDGQEIDTKSWTTAYEKAAEIEDDIRNDKFIESHWDGLYERVVKQ